MTSRTLRDGLGTKRVLDLFFTTFGEKLERWMDAIARHGGIRPDIAMAADSEERIASIFASELRSLC